MAKGKVSRMLNLGLASLIALPIFFSNPIYAEKELKDKPEKNIEYLIGNENIDKEKEKPKNALSVNAYYFLARTKRLGEEPYVEVSYERELADRLSFQAACGYMGPKGTDIYEVRRERLDVIPINAGLKYRIVGPLHIKGGASYFNYHLDCVHVPSELGGYAGIEISPAEKNKNLDFFFETRWQAGDLDIDYPLMEDETNISGWLIGGGARVRF